MDKINLNDFSAAVFARMKNNERYGQALFNELHARRPDLANELRSTDADPFYDVPDNDHVVSVTVARFWVAVGNYDLFV
jgi:hypothetical protein